MEPDPEPAPSLLARALTLVRASTLSGIRVGGAVGAIIAVMMWLQTSHAGFWPALIITTLTTGALGLAGGLSVGILRVAALLVMHRLASDGALPLVEGARIREIGMCARCDTGTFLEVARGHLHESVCPACNGRFLPPEESTRLLVDEMGFNPGFLKELTAHFAGNRLRCPGCALRMSPVRLRGVGVDLCEGCGGLWLDKGGLKRLSQGRHAELLLGPGSTSSPEDVPTAGKPPPDR